MKPIRIRNKDGVEMRIDHKGRIRPRIPPFYSEPCTETLTEKKAPILVDQVQQLADPSDTSPAAGERTGE